MRGDLGLSRAPKALPNNADQPGRRFLAARKLPCDPVAGARAAEPVWLARRGGVEFVAPAGAYAGLPAWRTRASWLVALRTHPRLVEACAGRVRPGLFLRVMAELSRYAAADTGRGIAVPHARIAEALGICTKTVQRSVRIAYSLGALHLVLAGTQMSIGQRSCVLDAYGRGVPSRRWRELPNFYAAVMPAEAAARVRAVDNDPAGHDHCPPSGTGRSAGTDPSRSYGESPFTPACGQRAGPSPERKGKEERPSAAQLGKSARPGPNLSAELEAYAAALCALLPGYRTVSLRRIGPGLRRYLDAGLSAADLQAGLDAYCRARGIAWLTTWSPEHRAEQARYLTGMLTHARQTGFLTRRR